MMDDHVNQTAGRPRIEVGGHRCARFDGGGPTSAECGSGTLMIAVLAVVILALAGVLVTAGVMARHRAQVEGAADLSALSGGHARLAGLSACDAADRTAQQNGVDLESCKESGDEIKFVVTVTVRSHVVWGPWQQDLTARANAGVLTGAPS